MTQGSPSEERLMLKQWSVYSISQGEATERTIAPSLLTILG